MAEFKLDRIRFRWKGAWSSTTAYIKDDVVSYGGKVYVCIFAVQIILHRFLATRLGPTVHDHKTR